MKRLRDAYNYYFGKKLDLSALPLDIQQTILSSNPELIRKGRQLNAKMRSRLTNAYLDKICNEPISNTELVNNRFTIKTWFDYYRITEEDMPGLESRDVSFFDFVIDWQKMTGGHHVSFVKYLTSNIYHFDVHLNNGMQSQFYRRIETGKSLSPYIDVITSWLIYSKRLDCVQLDPNYPQRQTIKTFQQFVAKYKTRKIGDLIFLYSYLITQIWLFGATYQASKKFYIAVDNNDVALADQEIVSELAPKINRYTPFDAKMIIPDVYEYLYPRIDEMTTFVINVLHTVVFDYAKGSYSFKTPS